MEARARPHIESAASPGAAGAAAYFMRSTHAGARRADDVMAQTNVSAMKMTGEPPSDAEACGMRKNAIQVSAKKN